MRNRSILSERAEIALSNGSSIPRYPDILVGGFPCQDLSIAGKKAGINGEKSGLWAEFKGAIVEFHPTWVVIENVGHTWRRWVPIVRRDLQRFGYASLPVRVRASDLGAPHARSRIFIVANPNGELLRELSRWWLGPGRQVAQEFARSWDSRPRRLGETSGFPGGVDRRTALGNAVIPPIVRVIARGIKEISK